MKITNKIAESMATTMTAPARGKVAELRKAYEQAVISTYLQTVPQVVQDMFVNPELKPWMRTTRTITPYGMGLPRNKDERVDISLSAPNLPTKEGGISLQLTEKTEHITHAYNAWEQAVKDAAELKAELEVVLRNLRTYERIQKELPEAVPHLPEPVTIAALTVDTSKIREKLAELPKTTD